MRSVASSVFLLCCAWMAPAFAGIDDALNEIRRKGCDGRPGVVQPLRPNRELDAVAREWSKGGRLRDAMARSNYRATNSASMQVQGVPDDKTALSVFRANYCDTITDPTFKEIGVFRRGGGIWVVVAAPFVAPEVKDAAQVSQKVLMLVNAARAKGRKCGRSAFAAAPPLVSSAALNRAALIHSQDMARKDFFEHVGSDGSKVGDRVTRVGYKWRMVGENIAIGAQTPEIVVEGWLNSPGHCANLMSPSFTEMGVAYVVDPKSEAGIYWTQVFAAPQ